MRLIRARVAGIIVAPATPSRPRARISTVGSGEYAAITEAAPKATAPTMSSLRWPIRSPSRPMVMRNPAIMNP